MDKGILQTAIPDSSVSIPLREVLRYMGCPRDAESAMTDLGQRAAGEIAAVAAYKACTIRLPLRFCEGLPDLSWGPAPSKNLGRALSGCREVLLMAATVGPAVDLRIRRASALHPSMALALQAAGTAAVEEWCDVLCARLGRELADEGLQLRPRFSPGYGDFALENQRELFRLLDCPRKIGLTLTESLLMAPSKSVTAVVGLQPGGESCPPSGCEACGKNCDFRRS